LIAETLPKYFGKWNETLEKNNGLLVGSGFSYVDFAIASFVELFSGKLGGTILDKYPALKAHQLKVFAAPGIKEWVAKRPVTEN
jgi:glutathione S-transferase